MTTSGNMFIYRSLKELSPWGGEVIATNLGACPGQQLGGGAGDNRFKRMGGNTRRDRQVESWFNSPEIGHQRWQSKFGGPKEHSHENGRNSAGESHGQSQTEACKSHPRWRHSERN